jgi:hypothetical protein
MEGDQGAGRRHRRRAGAGAQARRRGAPSTGQRRSLCSAVSAAAARTTSRMCLLLGAAAAARRGWRAGRAAVTGRTAWPATACTIAAILECSAQESNWAGCSGGRGAGSSGVEQLATQQSPERKETQQREHQIGVGSAGQGQQAQPAEKSRCTCGAGQRRQRHQRSALHILWRLVLCLPRMEL